MREPLPLRQILFLVGILGPMTFPPAEYVPTLTQALMTGAFGALLCGMLLKFIFPVSPRMTTGVWVSFAFGIIFAGPAIDGFLDFASLTAEKSLSWHQTPLWIVGKVGGFYQSSLGISPELSSVAATIRHFVACFLFVGLPEEMLKFLPLLVLLRLRQLRSSRDVWCIAAYSALGFGIAEAFWYLSRHDVELDEFSAVIGRAVGCPLMHVSMTLCAAWIFIRLSARRKKVGISLHKVSRSSLVAVSLAGLLHAAYDFLLLTNLTPLAGILAVASCLFIVSTEVFSSQPRNKHYRPRFEESKPVTPLQARAVRSA